MICVFPFRNVLLQESSSQIGFFSESSANSSGFIVFTKSYPSIEIWLRSPSPLGPLYAAPPTPVSSYSFERTLFVPSSRYRTMTTPFVSSPSPSSAATRHPPARHDWSVRESASKNVMMRFILFIKLSFLNIPSYLVCRKSIKNIDVA